MLYLLQAAQTVQLISAAGAILAVCLVVAAFLVTRTIYKSTLPTSQAKAWQDNYNAEKIRAENAAKQVGELLAAKAKVDKEHADLSLEFVQLSQLFAKKSIILDNITGEFTRLADLAEEGELGRYLRAVKHPVDDIHETKDSSKRDKTKERG